MEPHDDATPTDVSSETAAPDAGDTAAAPVAAAKPASANPQVAAALRELDEIADRPLAEHPDAYGRVHSGLQQALADIDDA